ncbi:hypothetical protein L7F22_064897 [Adiantum nelumboides]|nr:hypothetical protein [Adiantum nelumboides]
MQERSRQARQTVIDKLQRSEGRDISKFCRVYEQAMEDNGTQDWEAVEGFHSIFVPKLRAPIVELQTHQGAKWQDFQKALKEEYFLEDSQRVISKAKEDDAKPYGEIWPYALKTVERGKVSRGKLCKAGNCIRETTGWSDPIDLLLVYAYIAKSKANEGWVEEKQKWDEEIARSSKRATKSSNKKEEDPKPLPEVNMEDAPKDKKQGKPRGPSYKLKSDTKLATDLKKVFEERILNSKVEMTLGDVLGIAKRSVKVHSIEVYEMLLQLKQGFEEMIKVQVETKYKMVAKKAKPVATFLPEGSNKVMEEAS